MRLHPSSPPGIQIKPPKEHDSLQLLRQLHPQPNVVETTQPPDSPPLLMCPVIQRVNLLSVTAAQLASPFATKNRILLVSKGETVGLLLKLSASLISWINITNKLLLHPVVILTTAMSVPAIGTDFPSNTPYFALPACQATAENYTAIARKLAPVA